MESLTDEQRQKVLDLKQGRFYKYDNPDDDNILIGKFNQIINYPSQSLIWFGVDDGEPCVQISRNTCAINRDDSFSRSVNMINHITLVEKPIDAPPTWPSDADLIAISGCGQASAVGGRRRKTRRGSKKAKRSKRRSRKH